MSMLEFLRERENRENSKRQKSLSKTETIQERQTALRLIEKTEKTSTTKKYQTPKKKSGYGGRTRSSGSLLKYFSSSEQMHTQYSMKKQISATSPFHNDSQKLKQLVQNENSKEIHKMMFMRALSSYKKLVPEVETPHNPTEPDLQQKKKALYQTLETNKWKILHTAQKKGKLVQQRSFRVQIPKAEPIIRQIIHQLPKEHRQTESQIDIKRNLLQKLQEQRKQRLRIEEVMREKQRRDHQANQRQKQQIQRKQHQMQEQIRKLQQQKNSLIEKMKMAEDKQPIPSKIKKVEQPEEPSHVKVLKEDTDKKNILKMPPKMEELDNLDNLKELNTVETHKKKTTKAETKEIKEIKEIKQVKQPSKVKPPQKKAIAQDEQVEEIALQPPKSKAQPKPEVKTEPKQQSKPPMKEQIKPVPPKAEPKLPPKPPSKQQFEEDSEESERDIDEMKEMLNLIGQTIGHGSKELKGIDIGWTIPCFFLYRKFYQLRIVLLRNYQEFVADGSASKKQVDQMKTENDKIKQSLEKMGAACLKKTNDQALKNKINQKFQSNVNAHLHQYVEDYIKQVNSRQASLPEDQRTKVKFHLLMIVNSILVILDFEGKQSTPLTNEQLQADSTKKSLNVILQKAIATMRKFRDMK